MVYITCFGFLIFQETSITVSTPKCKETPDEVATMKQAVADEGTYLSLRPLSVHTPSLSPMYQK